MEKDHIQSQLYHLTTERQVGMFGLLVPDSQTGGQDTEALETLQLRLKLSESEKQILLLSTQVKNLQGVPFYPPFYICDLCRRAQCLCGASRFTS
jgi:hypothetical protein